MIILPSLEIVPAKYDGSTLLSQIPVNGTGDFTVSRALNTATRVNSLGNIELVDADRPRLDYFASDGTVGCPSLLVEPSGTNGILNSADTTTSWTLGANLTSGAIDVIGVTGNNITVAASGSNIGSAAGCHQRVSNNITLTSGSTYTISFLIKKTGTHTIGGFFANTSGATSTAFGGGFDVSGSFSSGSLIQSSPITNRIRRVEQWGTDVYRCSETFTMTATNVLTTFRLGPTVSVTDLTNSAVGTQLGFAAPQLELGSVPTSFIPTTTAAVTRNADVVSVSGAVSGSIGQTQGTIYAEVDVQRAFLGAILTIDDGDTSDFISILRLGNFQIRARIRRANSTITSIITSAAVSVGTHKIALAYTNGDYALYIDGVNAGTSTNSTDYPATSLTQCVLSNTNYVPFNDRILSAALYTTRLTDTQLALLTSPYTSYSSMASALSYTLG